MGAVAPAEIVRIVPVHAGTLALPFADLVSGSREHPVNLFLLEAILKQRRKRSKDQIADFSSVVPNYSS